MKRYKRGRLETELDDDAIAADLYGMGTRSGTEMRTGFNEPPQTLYTRDVDAAILQYSLEFCQRFPDLVTKSIYETQDRGANISNGLPNLDYRCNFVQDCDAGVHLTNIQQRCGGTNEYPCPCTWPDEDPGDNFYRKLQPTGETSTSFSQESENRCQPSFTEDKCANQKLSYESENGGAYEVDWNVTGSLSCSDLITAKGNKYLGRSEFNMTRDGARFPKEDTSDRPSFGSSSNSFRKFCDKTDATDNNEGFDSRTSSTPSCGKTTLSGLSGPTMTTMEEKKEKTSTMSSAKDQLPAKWQADQNKSEDRKTTCCGLCNKKTKYSDSGYRKAGTQQGLDGNENLQMDAIRQLSDDPKKGRLSAKGIDQHNTTVSQESSIKISPASRLQAKEAAFQNTPPLKPSVDTVRTRKPVDGVCSSGTVKEVLSYRDVCLPYKQSEERDEISKCETSLQGSTSFCWPSNMDSSVTINKKSVITQAPQPEDVCWETKFSDQKRNSCESNCWPEQLDSIPSSKDNQFDGDTSETDNEGLGLICPIPLNETTRYKGDDNKSTNVRHKENLLMQGMQDKDLGASVADQSFDQSTTNNNQASFANLCTSRSIMQNGCENFIPMADNNDESQVCKQAVEKEAQSGPPCCNPFSPQIDSTSPEGLLQQQRAADDALSKSSKNMTVDAAMGTPPYACSPNLPGSVCRRRALQTSYDTWSPLTDTSGERSAKLKKNKQLKKNRDAVKKEGDPMQLKMPQPYSGIIMPDMMKPGRVPDDALPGPYKNNERAKR